ncbi:MAG: T9SS type A sorting domain-containing protein, partial [Bacteroidales bacterium]|nr:T9SS type A sorting domain-containing protein [Bacteroidales bacterium]
MSKPYYCYPNPANESLNIEFSPDVNCRSVGIYSLDGRLVETFPETSPETSIDISNLTPGIYILKVKTTDGKEYTERIVKE